MSVRRVNVRGERDNQPNTPTERQAMTALLTLTPPTRGPAYETAKPETRQAWLEFRQGGLTATEMRDWRLGSKKRAIITEKVTGQVGEDIGHIAAVRHGRLREPQIAAWVEANFGITANDAAYASGENARWIATPDGITIDPFTGELVVGTEDARLSEIKTANKDLTPGLINEDRVLMEVSPGTAFDRYGYYTQFQGQMLVMNATMTLFVWEQHDGVIDPETGTYSPVGPPQWVWIPRDQKFIDDLVANTLTPALAEIDAARLANSLGELPPASDLPSEHAALVADLLAARDAEAVASAAKDKAWKALQAFYLAPGTEDVSIDAGFAKVTVSTTTGTKTVVDTEAMKKKAPSLVAKYEALRERNTFKEPTSSRRLTVTRSGNVRGEQ